MKYALVRVVAQGIGRAGTEHFLNGLMPIDPSDKKRICLSGTSWLLELESGTDYLVEILALAEKFEYPYEVWYFDQEPTRFSKKSTG